MKIEGSNKKVIEMSRKETFILGGFVAMAAACVGGMIYTGEKARNRAEVANKTVLEKYGASDGVLPIERSRDFVYGEYDGKPNGVPDGVISIEEGRNVLNDARFYGRERTGGSPDTERRILEALRLIDAEQAKKVVGNPQNDFHLYRFFVETELEIEEIEKLDEFNNGMIVWGISTMESSSPTPQYSVWIVTRLSSEETLTRIQKSTDIEDSFFIQDDTARESDILRCTNDL